MKEDGNMLAENKRDEIYMTWQNPERVVDHVEHGLPFRIPNGRPLG